MPHDDLPHKPHRTTPGICPHCGHSHSAYDHQASTVLDCLVIATEALSTATEAVRTLKDAIEEEVLP